MEANLNPKGARARARTAAGVQAARGGHCCGRQEPRCPARRWGHPKPKFQLSACFPPSRLSTQAGFPPRRQVPCIPSPRLATHQPAAVPVASVRGAAMLRRTPRDPMLPSHPRDNGRRAKVDGLRFRGEPFCPPLAQRQNVRAAGCCRRSRTAAARGAFPETMGAALHPRRGGRICPAPASEAVRATREPGSRASSAAARCARLDPCLPRSVGSRERMSPVKAQRTSPGASIDAMRCAMLPALPQSQ